MRISILGNSDTTGMRLDSGARVWPALLKERLSDSVSEPVVVDSWRFAPYRPGAVRYALDLVKDAQPDFVVLTLASYWCAFGTVRARVEQRFGRRAAVLYSRGEQAYARRFERGGQSGKRGPSIGRRLTRRVVGTATAMTFSQFVDVYAWFENCPSRNSSNCWSWATTTTRRMSIASSRGSLAPSPASRA